MLEVKGGFLAGSFVWEHDPFFRPTLALSTAGMLKGAFPTFRRPPAADGGPWACHVPEKAIAIDPSSEQVVSCLETGEVLHISVPPTESIGERPETVLDLLRTARRRRRPFDGGGFRHFLTLPLVDQITILADDILAAPPDRDRRAEIEREVCAGDATILDIRDRLLRSEGFWSRRALSVDELPGKWLVWQGLELCSSAVLRRSPPRGGRLARSDEIRLSGYLAPSRSFDETAEHLARLSLGPNPPDRLEMAWIDVHRPAIADLIDLARRVVNASGRDRPLRAVLPRFPNLLSALSLGPAGRRQGSGIEAARGGAGLMASGPQLWLGAGMYRLSLDVVAEARDPSRQGAPGDGAASLTAEFAYRNLILAQRQWRLQPGETTPCRLDFRIDDDQARFLNEGAYDFRLWSDGGGRLRIGHADFERLEGDAAADAALPSDLIDWRAGMRPGRTSSRRPSLLSRFREPPVVLCYGPYGRLLPGRYVLEVEFAAGPMTRGRGRLRITRAPNATVASTWFGAKPGTNRIELGFRIPEAATFDALPDDIEFVVRLPVGADARLSRVTTRRLADDGSQDGSSAAPPATSA